MKGSRRLRAKRRVCALSTSINLTYLTPPPIAITKYRIAIFCDSEFFHGYNWEIKKQKLGHNQEYWIKKVERNMARDWENDFKLIAMDRVPMHFFLEGGG